MVAQDGGPGVDFLGLGDIDKKALEVTYLNMVKNGK